MGRLETLGSESLFEFLGLLPAQLRQFGLAPPLPAPNPTRRRSGLPSVGLPNKAKKCCTHAARSLATRKLVQRVPASKRIALTARTFRQPDADLRGRAAAGPSDQ